MRDCTFVDIDGPIALWTFCCGLNESFLLLISVLAGSRRVVTGMRLNYFFLKILHNNLFPLSVKRVVVVVVNDEELLVGI